MGRRAALVVAWVGGVGLGVFCTAAFLGLPRSGAFGPFGLKKDAQTLAEMFPSDIPEDRDWGTSVSQEIAAILRTDPRASSGHDKSLVIQFLRDWGDAASRTISEQEAQDAEVRWVADGVMTWLRRGMEQADDVARELIGIARKETNAVALREAALIHLGMCRVSAPVRQSVGRELCAICAESASRPWVGVALGLLGREVFVAEQPEWVRERCMEMAADPQAHVLCRIAAFDLAARRGWQEAEPLARIQSVSAAATTERVSALHVLAEVGNEDTLRWLQKWEPPRDAFVEACLDATRKRLRERAPAF